MYQIKIFRSFTKGLLAIKNQTSKTPFGIINKSNTIMNICIDIYEYCNYYIVMKMHLGLKRNKIGPKIQPKMGRKMRHKIKLKKY